MDSVPVRAQSPPVVGMEDQRRERVWSIPGRGPWICAVRRLAFPPRPRVASGLGQRLGCEPTAEGGGVRRAVDVIFLDALRCGEDGGHELSPIEQR